MRRNFKNITTFSNVYSNCQLQIMQSSYKHLKYIPDTYNMSTQKQTPSTVSSPRHDEAQDMEGGYVILTHAQNFISTSETPVQIEM